MKFCFEHHNLSKSPAWLLGKPDIFLIDAPKLTVMFFYLNEILYLASMQSDKISVITTYDFVYTEEIIVY